MGSQESLKMEGGSKGKTEEGMTTEECLKRCNIAGVEDGGREP